MVASLGLCVYLKPPLWPDIYPLNERGSETAACFSGRLFQELRSPGSRSRLQGNVLQISRNGCSSFNTFESTFLLARLLTGYGLYMSLETRCTIRTWFCLCQLCIHSVLIQHTSVQSQLRNKFTLPPTTDCDLAAYSMLGTQSVLGSSSKYFRLFYLWMVK